MLEELGVPYTVTPIDIGKDEQFAPEFLVISPNNKIPAIVDHETGIHLMELGAILMYIPRREARPLHAVRAGEMASDRVADVADGRDRPFPGPGASFPAL